MLTALAVLASLGTFVALVAVLLPSQLGVSRSEAVLALLASAALAVLVLTWLAYGHRPAPVVRRTASNAKRVAFVVAFWHATPEKLYLEGEIVPGSANVRLADWVRREAHGFSAVLTQEAVIRALGASSASCGERPALTIGETPVYPMHKHVPRINVRTLASLACALDRMAEFDGEFVLVLAAHPGQVERAGRDLSVLYAGPVLDAPDGAGLLQDMPYSGVHRVEPLQWAFREVLFARPIEFVQRAWIRPTGRAASCPVEVRLGPIDWKAATTTNQESAAPPDTP